MLIFCMENVDVICVSIFGIFLFIIQTRGFSAQNINIEHLANGSKGEIAYTIVETNVEAGADILNTLTAIEGVFGVRTFS